MMVFGSSVPAVDRAHSLFGEGGSWSADHSYLARSRFLSLVLLGESVCLLKQQRINLGGLQEGTTELYAPPDGPCGYHSHT